MMVVIASVVMLMPVTSLLKLNVCKLVSYKFKLVTITKVSTSKLVNSYLIMINDYHYYDLWLGFWSTQSLLIKQH